MWYDVSLRYIFLHDLDDKNAFNEEELEKVAQNVLKIFSHFILLIFSCGDLA